MARIGRGVAICLLPVLVALWVGATTFPGGTALPWRPVMVDLDVYRQAGRVLLDGGNFYQLPGPLPFLYPPFAALLAVPLAVLPAALVQIGWTVAGALCSSPSCTGGADRVGAEPVSTAVVFASSRSARPSPSVSSASSWSLWWCWISPPVRGCSGAAGCCPRGC